jgi:hypothetical protein
VRGQLAGFELERRHAKAELETALDSPDEQPHGKDPQVVADRQEVLAAARVLLLHRLDDEHAVHLGRWL